MKISGTITHTIFTNEEFSIRSFRSDSMIELPNGNMSRNFHIKGLFIPDSSLKLQIEGEFDAKPYEKNGRKSFTFNVEPIKQP